MNFLRESGKQSCLHFVRCQASSYNYLVSITMIGPHAVNRMLPTAYGTV
jgi:hypothetical protein